MVDSQELMPIAVAIDELKSQDKKKRVSSVRTLNTIALALGPDRTRMELFPYLMELMDDDEEVLIALAETLPTMLDQAGGPQHAESLLKPLEKLMDSEETTIREKVSPSPIFVLTSANVSGIRRRRA